MLFRVKNVIFRPMESLDVLSFENVLKSLDSILKRYVEDNSDIDIAIESKELTPQIKSHLEFIFEDSTIPYKIDIIDLNNVTEKFRSLIEPDLVEI